MAIAELPPRASAVASGTGRDAGAHTDRASAPPQRRGPTVEHLTYLILFGLALFIHLYALGDGALHHDETHHANYSWRLFMGLGFIHDPLLHGPFLYHINALFFFLFGDSNATARLGPALFGSALVVMPFLLRRELGRGAALMASIYLLISPAYLYWGRHIRHDMYCVVFEMMTFVAIVRYASTRRPFWLYVAAAALGFMFTDMETFYLYVAIFAPLLIVVMLWKVWKPGIIVAGVIGVALISAVFILPGKPLNSGGAVQRSSGAYVCPSSENLFPPDNPIKANPGPIFGFAPLPTADNDYALCVRNQPDDSFIVYFAKLSQFFGHPAILIALAITLLGLAALYVLIWRRRASAQPSPWQHARSRPDAILDAFASLATGKRVLIALGIFFTIYALFFTAFLVHPTGIISGTTGSLLYWLAQHGVARGSQPRYYYLILLALYEPLVVIWGIIGLVMTGVLIAKQLRAPASARPRSQAPSTINWPLVMPIMLCWWAVMTLLLYSWAGEKMPWLTIHIALPFVLLGSWALARTLGWWRTSAQPAEPIFDSDEAEGHSNGFAQPAPSHLPDRGALLIYFGIFSTIMLFGYQTISLLSKPDNAQQWQLPYILIGIVVFVGLLTLGAALLRSLRWGVGILALAVTLLISSYSIMSAYRLSFIGPDVANEKMIFVQTSPDVARVINNLELASTRRGGSLDMPIMYDNETVWAWYLRRFTNKQQIPQLLSTPPAPEVQAVLMLQENIDSNSQNLANLNGFRIQRFPLRWWFPNEGNRLPDNWLTSPLSPSSPPLMRLLRNPMDSRTQAQLWQYLLYRTPPDSLGAVDFVIAVRPDLADEIGLGAGGNSDR